MPDTHTEKLPFNEDEMMDMLNKYIDAKLANTPTVDTEKYKCTDEEKELWDKLMSLNDLDEEIKVFEMILDMNSEPVIDKDT